MEVELKKGYNKGDKVSKADRIKICEIVAENLRERMSLDYKSVNWQVIMKEVYSCLPHLNEIPVGTLQNINNYELRRNNRKPDRSGLKADSRFTPDVCTALYDTFQKYFNKDTGRLARKSWPRIYEDMRKEFPDLRDVEDLAIKSLYFRERGRRKK